MANTAAVAAFSALHQPGQPIVLYNIWDAGSARAVAAAGASAVATGSASVAAAQGYADGEQLPLTDLVRTTEQIVRAVALPVTVDMESGYGRDPATVGETARRLVTAGAVGCNIEDRIIDADGLYGTAVQVERLRAIRSALASHDLALHINARTDVFLAEPSASRHAARVPEALDRAAAYREAGANSLFVPGLADTALIATLCEQAPLPINVMWRSGMASIAALASVGVGRVSFGPGPYRDADARLRDAAQAIYAGGGP